MPKIIKSRQSILFYINQRRYEVFGDQCLMTLSDFLRYEKNLTGTKVVCAEGDCGACTVLVASVTGFKNKKLNFKSINSCIKPLFALDGCVIITVEGLKKQNTLGTELHPVQTSMLKNFGSQCGYCTPGFICAMASLVEDSKLQKKQITPQRAKNYLTGNLCRCTGYEPIIKSALDIDIAATETLQKRFHDFEIIKELLNAVAKPLEVAIENKKIFLPSTLKQALTIKKKYPNTLVLAGATDIGVWVNKGKLEYSHVMSLKNITNISEIKISKTEYFISPLTTLDQFQDVVKKQNSEINNMLNIFASLQIKNSGTIVGNVVNGSPIADSIPFLMALDAEIEIQSLNHKKYMPISEFYLGYKKLKLKSSELVTGIKLINFKSAKNNILKLYKVSLRKDLDISAVTMALRFELKNNLIQDCRIVIGGVGPTVARVYSLEEEVIGKNFSESLFLKLSENVANYITPLSDVRGTKEYRLKLSQNLFLKCSDELKHEGLLSC